MAVINVDIEQVGWFLNLMSLLTVISTIGGLQIWERINAFQSGAINTDMDVTLHQVHNGFGNTHHNNNFDTKGLPANFNGNNGHMNGQASSSSLGIPLGGGSGSPAVINTENQNGADMNGD